MRRLSGCHVTHLGGQLVILHICTKKATLCTKTMFPGGLHGTPKGVSCISPHFTVFYRILPYFTVFYRISHETLVGVPCGELCIWHHKKAGLGSETPRKQCGCAPKPPFVASLGPPLSIPLPGQWGHFQGSYGGARWCVVDHRQVTTWHNSLRP